MASEKPDFANYLEIANLLGAHPTEQVCHIKWASLGGMQATETLYLLGHGSATSGFENMDANTLAKKLVDKGLTKDASLKKVKLLCCGLGKTTARNPAFCVSLAKELQSAGGPSTIVVGFDGDYSVTNEAGKSFAVDHTEQAEAYMLQLEERFGLYIQLLDVYAEAHENGTGESMKKVAFELKGFAKQVKLEEFLYAEGGKLHKKGGKVYASPQGQFTRQSKGTA